jgi:chromosome segregation ATPase
MQQNRDDFEQRYEDRIRDLQSQLTQERGSTAGSVQELKESRSRIEALISKVSDLEGANLALNQKIADMAQEMEDQRSSHRAQLAAKDDEIKRLLDELTNQMKEYQSLQEIKIALDMEIAVFRRLLESEEDRLDMEVSRGADMSRGSSNEAITVERKSESSFQRKVTVSQTQL